MHACSECHRPVGLMADARGNAIRFHCPHTGRMAQAQMPVRRKPPARRKDMLDLPVIINRRNTIRPEDDAA